MTPVVTIVGASGSGKTTFIRKLLTALDALGISACVVKHTSHHATWGDKGRDTQIYRDSAAARTVFHCADGLAMFQKTDADYGLHQIAETFGNDVQVVIAEGYKGASAPKIEVFRKSVSKEMLFADSEELIAVISDNAPPVDAPVFGTDQAEEMAMFLVKHFGL